MGRSGCKRKKECRYKYAGNLIWDTPIDGLRLGTSLNNLKMTVTTRFTEDIPIEYLGQTLILAQKGEIAEIEYKKLENWVYSIEYTWEDLILMAEFMRINKKYKLDAFKAMTEIGNTEEDNTSTGWYVGGAYRFLDWLELGGYYSRSEYEEVDKPTDIPINFFKEFDDLCATLRFDINEFWAFKLEMHNFRGLYPVADSMMEEVLYHSEEKWKMYTVKMTVAF